MILRRLTTPLRHSLLFAAMCAACSEDRATAPAAIAGATSIEIAPGVLRIVPGDSVRLSAIARNAAGEEIQGATVAWTSRAPSLASVSRAGMVRAGALPAGTTEETVWIVAAAGALSDSARIVLTEPGSLGAPRMGINLDMVNDWSTEWPFTDVFRSSRRWVSNRNGAAWGEGGPLALTADNWVASLESGQYATTLMLNDFTRHQPGGDYVLLYDGEGDVQVEGGTALSVLSTARGRIALRLAAQAGLVVHLRRTDPGNPVRNIRLVRASSEAAYAATPFNPDFLRVIRPFGVIRFMNWQATNSEPPGEWARRSTPSLATWAGPWGVPVETMVALANETGADPWFCMPHSASDDYVRQFATLVHARLGPRQKVYVEYSNEVWNSIFPQAAYAIDHGVALNLSADRNQAALRFQSQRSLEVFAIWRSAVGADSLRVVRVMASQSANTWTAEQLLGWRDAFRQTDALAIAPYFGGRMGMSDGAALSSMSETQVLDSLARELETTTRGLIDANAKIARAYGVKLVAYEAGQHLVSARVLPQYEPAVTRLFAAANRNPRMGELYLRYFELWYAAGGDLIMPFVAVSAWDKYGSWGALEYVHQEPATSPKYTALLEAAARFGR